MSAERIALFLPSLHGGGAERVMVTLANALAARERMVDLVLMTKEGPYLKEVDPRVSVVDLKSRRAVRSFGPLMRYLRAMRPAVLMSTVGQANFIALMCRAIAAPRMRLIIREATTMTEYARTSATRKERVILAALPWAYRLADLVIAPSAGVAADLQSLLGVTSPPIVTIANPIDAEELRSLARQEVEHPWLRHPTMLVIVSAGRMTAAKDYTTLIRAFAIVASRMPAARLLILGDGEERMKLASLVSQLGLDERVHMPGFVDNPFKFMKRSAAYVLSSVSEGMPNTLLQAVALGLPAISTDCRSGPREILDGGRWGALVPVGDPERLADAMQKALEGGVAVMPAQAFEQRFGVGPNVAKYLEAFAT